MPELSGNFEVSKVVADRRKLEANPYPGRVLIMGTNQSGDQAHQAYALMGRSEGSRNRVFSQEGTSVRTIAPDKTQAEMDKTKGGELIYYRAMREGGQVHVVSNGAQTDPVFDFVTAGYSLDEAMRNAPAVEVRQGRRTEAIELSKFEPDDPNFTPRITGVLDLRDDAVLPFALSVTRRVLKTDLAETTMYYSDKLPFDSPPGLGYGVQTYAGDGNPLPSFDGDPFAFEMGEHHRETASALWDVLNQDNLVAVVTRAIDLQTGQPVGTTIINGRA